MRVIGAVLASLALAAAVGAGADTRTVQHAQAAIRRLVTDSGAWTRVTFKKSSEQVVSSSETRVSGDGVAARRDGRDDM